jgi:hypothetical protein
MSKWVGREGVLAVGDLSIGVRVIDARRNWGSFHVQVEPLNGSGSQWVDSTRVRLAVNQVPVR